MRTFSLNPIQCSTRMTPVGAHAAHIRHLSRPSALEQLLIERHALTGAVARRRSFEVAPFLEQALHFYESACRSDVRVRSVLQYYAYLNLAVGIVLVYRPSGWEQFRKHGAEDHTRSLKKLSLSSGVVQMRPGAVPLFHSVLSTAVAPTRRLTLRNLLVHIPMVALELKEAFSIRPLAVRVGFSLEDRGIPPNHKVSAVIRLNLCDTNNPPTWSPGTATLPVNRFRQAIPELGSQFRITQHQKHLTEFESNQNWTPGNRERAQAFLEDVAFRAANFGGQFVGPNLNVEYLWRFERTSPILPTLTAGLLLSFVLASLSRYRANILDRVESSKVNLLCEVFASEADGFMIPAFRNLLYREAMYVNPTPYT